MTPHPLAGGGTPGRLVVVCGPPGSGKTTVARRLVAERGGLRFCPDEWLLALGADLWDEQLRARVEALQWRCALDLLRSGGAAVLEWGTWGRSERETLLAGARRLGAAAELVVLEVPLAELERRVSARAAEEPPLTRAHLDRYAVQFEVPDAAERARWDPPPSPSPVVAGGPQ